MSLLLAAVVVAVLGSIAAAGVVAGFRRRDVVAVEALADPLEDRRLALQRSLADLEDARGAGALDDDGYRRLRSETDARLERVDRALAGRAPAADPSPGSVPAAGAPQPPKQVPTWAVGILLAGVVSAVVLTSLTRRTEAPPVASAPGADASDPFAFFEQRVREHPDDVAARLDLAHRYLDLGRADEALAEYTVALELDPDDAEAHAHVGLILYGGGRIEEALASVDRALATDPAYPEALLIRGVILLEGLDRPREAIVAFEGYLDAAPFGSARGNVEGLILQAEAALAGREGQGST